jgi:hypothetical protein
MTVRWFLSAVGLGVAGLALLASVATARPADSSGTAIVSVKAFPYPQTVIGVSARARHPIPLTPTKLTTVTASTVLAFKVQIHNATADSKSHLFVTLTIDRHGFGGGPIVLTRVLNALPANRTKTVTFSHIGTVPFASKTSLTVYTASGSHVAYPVIFALA